MANASHHIVVRAQKCFSDVSSKAMITSVPPTEDPATPPRTVEQALAAASSSDWPAFKKWLLAFAIFLFAALGRLALDQIVPDRLPFGTFYPAVILSSFLCGFWPGLLVVLLCVLASAVWIVTAQSPILAWLVGLALFLGTSSLSIFLINALQVANRQLQSRDQQLELINRELKHRIKNLFTIAASICRQTIRQGQSIAEMTTAATGRINALASAHDFLGATSKDGALVLDLVNALVATLAPDPSRLKIDGVPVRLPPDVTTPFALVLHELGTNAVKYGAWSSSAGTIQTRWQFAEGVLQFEWREHDGPVIAPPKREGLGSELIRRGLNGATVEQHFEPDGLRCSISLPLPTQGD